MKLKTAFLLFTVLSANIITGQTKYGFKIGTGFSDQSKTISPPGYPAENIETKILLGFQAGGFLKYSINSKLILEADVNFVLCGSKTKYTRTDFIVNPDGSISGETTGYFNDRVYKLEVPLILQYHISKFYLGLGPSFGIIIASKINDLQNKNFKSNYYKPFDLTANGIIGYSISKKVDINAGYYHSILDIDNKDHSKITNQALIFSVLYNLK